MGRRALRKIAPEIDLSRHLKTLDELPKPWTTTAVFPCDAPLEIEAGSGKGLFLRSAAAAHPERNYLGSEVAEKYARFAAAGLAKRGLTNAAVVRGDAVRMFEEILADSSVHAVHVYFPDPWWKARHKKRRVMREALLRNVQRVLVPDGQLHFWTDVEEYYQTSLDLIREATILVGPLEVPETPATHDLDYRTHFERRTRLHGERVFRAEFRKAAAGP